MFRFNGPHYWISSPGLKVSKTFRNIHVSVIQWFFVLKCPSHEEIRKNVGTFQTSNLMSIAPLKVFEWTQWCDIRTVYSQCCCIWPTWNKAKKLFWFSEPCLSLCEPLKHWELILLITKFANHAQQEPPIFTTSSMWLNIGPNYYIRSQLTKSRKRAIICHYYSHWINDWKFTKVTKINRQLIRPSRK